MENEEVVKLINDWYYFIDAIDDSTCEKLITLGQNNFTKAVVGNDIKPTEEERIKGRNVLYKGTENKKRRKSKVAWVEEQWVYDLINPFMAEANEKSGWNFDITSSESPQLTKYEKDDFFGWHIDGYSDSLSTYDLPKNKFLDKNVRKVSMTILLIDDYEGGNFEFGFFNSGEVSVSKPKFSTRGSIIFFPSFINHQVTPVTEGTRYSLVAWFLGPHFR